MPEWGRKKRIKLGEAVGNYRSCNVKQAAVDELYCRAVSGIGQARRARGTRDVLVIQAPETRGTMTQWGCEGRGAPPQIQFKLRLHLLGLASSKIKINLAPAGFENSYYSASANLV